MNSLRLASDDALVLKGSEIPPSVIADNEVPIPRGVMHGAQELSDHSGSLQSAVTSAKRQMVRLARIGAGANVITDFEVERLGDSILVTGHAWHLPSLDTSQ